MQKTDGSASPSGHCKAILSKGPFKIGIDFEPPMPAGRKLWHVELCAKVLSELEACLKRNGAVVDGPIELNDPEIDQALFQDALWHRELLHGVSAAIDWFVSDTEFQPAEKSIRDRLRDLQRAIQLFEASLPSEHDALGYFIQRTYTGDAFLKDGVKPDADALTVLQQAWRDRYGIDATRSHLEVMKAYVAAAGECLGNNKPLEHRKTTLVRGLARVWKRLTGKWPTSGRLEYPAKQTGAFAEFVRIACAQLPEGFSACPLNDAIRRVCEAPDPD